ncbi:hypothetical protein N9B72_00265 [Bacteriovoracaceae bacterium]|nr:hypothetical protein [Bacteriovoracaceae bacterium]
MYWQKIKACKELNLYPKSPLDSVFISSFGAGDLLYLSRKNKEDLFHDMYSDQMEK